MVGVIILSQTCFNIFETRCYAGDIELGSENDGKFAPNQDEFCEVGEATEEGDESVFVEDGVGSIPNTERATRAGAWGVSLLDGRAPAVVGICKPIHQNPISMLPKHKTTGS